MDHKCPSVTKECFIKLTINNKQLHFEINLLMKFVDEVFLFFKNNANLLILKISYFFKNATNFVIVPHIKSSSQSPARKIHSLKYLKHQITPKLALEDQFFSSGSQTVLSKENASLPVPKVNLFFFWFSFI